MAHFAQLDEENKVINIIVVSNPVLERFGVEDEQYGIDFCKGLYGEDTRWVQTSYNGNFRGRFAGIGSTYDSLNDVFIYPKPYPSWVLDETFAWQAPVQKPEIEDGFAASWDEDNQEWRMFKISDLE